MFKTFSILLGGPAGTGIKSTGLILAEAFNNGGYNTFAYSEYPSLIRGGHNSYQVVVSENYANIVSENIDILLAFDSLTVRKHINRLASNGLLIFDSKKVSLAAGIREVISKNKVKTIKVDLQKVVETAGGKEIMQNMAALAFIWALVDLDVEDLLKSVSLKFADKKKVILPNHKVVKAGFKAGQEKADVNKFLQSFTPDRQTLSKTEVQTGNQAVVEAIVRSDCGYYTAYPMTPSTSILETLINKVSKGQAKLFVKQAEDEILAIQAAIGASFAGVRATVATSGGGLALMTESLSMIGITEIPLVVIDSQRTAPATGMPTWTSQSDLSFTATAGHGDFPRIILAASDAKSAYNLMGQAFNLADKHQTLVLVLLDKYISESDFTIYPQDFETIKVSRGKLAKGNLEPGFKRYSLVKDGVSIRSIPGQKNGVYLANTDEHNQFGYTTEDPHIRQQMMDKRMTKMRAILKDIPEPDYWGDDKPDCIFVSWGSVNGSVRIVLENFKNEEWYQGAKIGHLAYQYLYPLNPKHIERFENTPLIFVENNYTGQFAALIKRELGLKAGQLYTKDNGQPFFKEELERLLKKGINKFRKQPNGGDW